MVRPDAHPGRRLAGPTGARASVSEESRTVTCPFARRGAWEGRSPTSTLTVLAALSGLRMPQGRSSRRGRTTHGGASRPVPVSRALPSLAVSGIREVRLHYHRARYYASGVGRFISEDPLGLADGMNLYAYVQGPGEFRSPMLMERYQSEGTSGRTLPSKQRP
jgi:hypothetical protein